MNDEELPAWFKGGGGGSGGGATNRSGGGGGAVAGPQSVRYQREQDVEEPPQPASPHHDDDTPSWARPGSSAPFRSENRSTVKNVPMTTMRSNAADDDGPPSDRPSWLGAQNRPTTTTSKTSMKSTLVKDKGKDKKGKADDEDEESKPSRFALTWKHRAIIVAVLSIIEWSVEFAQLKQGRDISKKNSIVSRQGSTFYSIFPYIFLHRSIEHLGFNIVPFAILLFFLLGRGWKMCFAFVCFWIGGGALLWCIGQDKPHVGLDLVNAAMFAFALLCGIFTRTFRLVIIALVSGGYCIVLSAGLLGTGKGMRGVRWDSLLIGAIIGSMTALVSYKLIPRCRRR
eukprot:c4605_g1_i1.p1 GENE.c4605_g1_i1~~c4605_g1_i1.p1  ORF type:complete len:351 (+),score=43.14 c4605_g1_i1:32-1054(+)